MPEYKLLKPAADATFDEIVDNYRAVTTTWGADKTPRSSGGHPNSVQWYGMCALPARWYGWNGRYSLAIGMVNDFFMADGSVSRPLEEWFSSKKFSTEPGDGTIANTFWMFVGREPRFYASVHFPNQRLSYAYDENKTDSYQDSDGYGVVDFWYSGVERQRQHSGRQEHLGILCAQEHSVGLPQQQADRRGHKDAERAVPSSSGWVRFTSITPRR